MGGVGGSGSGSVRVASMWFVRGCLSLLLHINRPLHLRGQP